MLLPKVQALHPLVNYDALAAQLRDALSQCAQLEGGGGTQPPTALVRLSRFLLGGVR